MIKQSNEALLRAIKIVGGQTALARCLGIKQQTVAVWIKTALPPRRVLAVEKATNYQVSRSDLGPDLYPAEEYNRQTLRKP